MPKITIVPKPKVKGALRGVQVFLDPAGDPYAMAVYDGGPTALCVEYRSIKDSLVFTGAPYRRLH